MCTLAVLRDICDAYPLVIAANRDEFYVRPTAPPALLADVPGVVSGRDLEAGGTWLGCRYERGVMVVGILNRRSPDGIGRGSTGELSRGLLCLDALRSSTVDEAVERVGHAELARYGPFNLLLADIRRAVVIQNADAPCITELASGLSLLTNLDVNDPRCARLASAVPAFRALSDRVKNELSADRIVGDCRTVLSSHENSLDPADASPLSRLCVHTDVYGTRSATVVLVGRDERVRYFHAPGPPCRTGFDEVGMSGPAMRG